jgi:hypothetical protein
MALVIGVGAGAGVTAALVTPSVAGATTTFTVNDAADWGVVGGYPGGDTTCTSTNPDQPTCTLRAAIEASYNLGESTTIVLPNSEDVTYNALPAYYIESQNGQLEFGGGATVTLEGAGQADTTIQATCTEDDTSCPGDLRVMKVDTGTTADVSGVTIEDGSKDNGGGILDCGTLNLSSSTVTNNTASVSGGGLELSSGGSATLDDDTVSDNSTPSATSGSEATTTGGAGIFLDGSLSSGENLTLNGTTVTQNTSSGNGGGVMIGGAGNTASVVDITDSHLDGNTLTGDDSFGGGLSQQALSTLTISGSTVSNNVPGEGDLAYGTGLYLGGLSSPTTLTDDTISGNQGDGAVGIYLAGAQTSITDSTISGNLSNSGGAGMYVWGTSGTTTTITGSTFSGNVTTDNNTGEDIERGDGGGLLNDGSGGCNPVTFVNDTIAGNSAAADGGGYLAINCGEEEGGAVKAAGGAGSVGGAGTAGAALVPHVTPTAAATFQFDTVAGNSAGDSAGGGNIQVGTPDNPDDSAVTLQDSIVADGIVGGTPTTNCEINDGGTGTITSLGYNLIDDTTCGTAAAGDIIGQGAQLGALGDNGGPTNTELPATGSPAIGGVPAAVCTATGVTSDQRGNARGAGLNGSCTIGAVEVSVTAPPAVNLNGYRLVANEGGIFDFGLNFHGSLANNHLNAPIVGIANSPGYDGYLMAGGDGGVFALGGANFYGSLGGQTIPSPISAIAAPPAENGYWLVAQNGKIYNFGAVPALPALSVPSGAHIVGAASTQDGAGLWLTDNLGDVYAEGDALYEGGLGGVHLNAPIVGIAAAASGQGYVLAASDGGVFNYGTQHFFGSVPGSLAPGQKLTAPIVGIAVTHSGNGYWLAGSDGGVFNYGDAPFLGSIYTAIGNHPLNGPVVGIQHLGELPTP